MILWLMFTDVLQIIVDMFLPHLPPSELEEECFSKILPKVRTVHSPDCVLLHKIITAGFIFPFGSLATGCGDVYWPFGRDCQAYWRPV